MYNKLVHKETRLALVGLGYVGLPIALEFAKKISVIGFDINEERLTMMRQGIDPCKELDSEAFENADIEFTSSIDELRKASFFIVAVPTPIDDHNQPDLTPLLGATRSVAKALKKGIMWCMNPRFIRAVRRRLYSCAGRNFRTESRCGF